MRNPRVSVSDYVPPATPDVDESTVPIRRDGIGEIFVDGQLVVGSDHYASSIVLDPVTAALWQSIDGRTSVGALTADLVEATGESAERAERVVTWLVKAMCVDGFLSEPAQLDPVTPRHLHPAIPVESCLGRRLGLASATIYQLRDTLGTPFRFASTDRALGERVAESFVTEVPDDDPAEMFTLRVTRSRSGRPRLQQLFDTIGNPLYVGRDLDEAAEALTRTIASRIELSHGIWTEGVALRQGNAVVLVHPSLRDRVVDQLRATLAGNGVGFVPSGLLRFESPNRFSTPGGAPNVDRLDVEITGVIQPTAATAVDQFRMVAHLARRWSNKSFQALDAMRTAGLLIEFEPEWSNEQLDQLLREALLAG